MHPAFQQSIFHHSPSPADEPGEFVRIMIIQIYEIQTPHEAEALIELGVDHVGSVILSESKWKVPSVRDTIDFARSVGARSSLIPLFGNVDAISRALEYYQPDIVHFCETLSSNGDILNRCKILVDNQVTIKKRFPAMRIMRSIPIAPPGLADRIPTLDLAAEFEPVSDIFLTDTLLVEASTADRDPNRQPVSGFIGITGRICDWQMARRLTGACDIPVVLAGGISPENAADGVKRVNPAGVDSCTGTNAVDAQGRPIRFRKDLLKVKQLVEAVRRAHINRQLPADKEGGRNHS